MPETAVDNQTVLSRVRDNFRGPEAEWEPIKQGIELVLVGWDSPAGQFSIGQVAALGL